MVTSQESAKMQSSTFAQNAELQLFNLFKKKSVLIRHPPEEPFELASGELSYEYFDCKMVTLDPLGINLVAQILVDRISHYSKVDAIGGLETGAIPIVTAVTQLSQIKGRPIPAFFVRQEKKKRGTKKWIEGNLEQGFKVIIVDDVTTKGGSAGKAVEKVEELGCKVLEIITLVDREEGAAKRFENYKFSPIFRMSQFRASR